MKSLLKFLLPVAVAASMLTGCNNASYVKQGEIGLLVNDFTGQIEQTLEPGYRMTMPFNKHIVEYPITDQQYVMVKSDGSAAGESQHADDDAVKVNSLEGQAFDVDCSVEYRLIGKDAVPPLYKKYGGKSFETVEAQYFRSKFRAAIINAFASMPLAEGITGAGRKKAETLAKKSIQEALTDDQINVIDVLVRSVHIPEAIAESIQNKTNAENELVQSRTKAQQQVVEAQAQAQARVAQAQGEAKAKLIEAQAAAKSRKEVGLSPDQYTRIETAKITAHAIENAQNLVILPSNSIVDARSLQLQKTAATSDQQGQ